MASEEPELSEADQLLRDQVTEWSANSNEALTVNLVRGGQELDSFNPNFTYPIYGEEEAIFGYQGLDISLQFAAHNLRPRVAFTYEHKFQSQGEIAATDVLEPLRDFLPESAFSSPDNVLEDASAATFSPPGERLQSFEAKTGSYEIWCAPLADPKAKEILQNMQILVPMFIEGGTILELEYDWIVERWKLFLLYKIDSDCSSTESKYIFAGYATSFRVFSLPERGDTLETSLTKEAGKDIDAILKSWAQSDQRPRKALSLPSRERISQFVLLPSQQGAGLGARLYSTMYDHLVSMPSTLELTVEDPNEAFDDMRDVSDLNHLRQHNKHFQSLTLPKSIPSSSLTATASIPIDLIVPPSTRASLASTSKIQPRQLSRLIEMQLLSTIPRLHRSTSRITRKEKSSNEHDRAYYFWRLLVKERLYQHNRDALAQLDREERVEKVEDAVEGVQRDYERLVELADRRAEMSKEAISGSTGAVNGSGKAKRARERVALLDDDAEEDEALEENEGDGVGQERGRKRRRVLDDEDEDVDDTT